MDHILFFISILIIFLGTINLVRMSLFLIGSDIYKLFFHINIRTLKQYYLPTISVVIPAYNEEKSIIHCIESVLKSDYPKERIEVIVVDDGSKDTTATLVNTYKKKHDLNNLTLISQSRVGKAHALNNGMKNAAESELVMSLDADSYLEKNALKNVTKYFLDTKVMAVASNVKIAKTGGLFNLIQQFEYIICYQMKRAHSIFNIEYIIGGIGSTFRKRYLEKIDFYDGNTVTEDIDLTMKILKNGNKQLKVMYGSDVIAYTQSVLSIQDLIKQRYRWKWGRYQTFLKNKSMFFSFDKKYTKGLTWFYLPYALFSDLAFLTEPIVVGFLLYVTIAYHDVTTIVSALIVITVYFIFNILGEDTILPKDKIIFILLAPIMYLLFYILSVVEYIALIKSLVNLPKLSRSLLQKDYCWTHVKRLG